jgi:hypothetical protein
VTVGDSGFDIGTMCLDNAARFSVHLAPMIV